MSQSKLKILRAEIEAECLRRGFPFKTAWRRFKRIYARTPRTERADFMIYERR